MDAFTEGFRAGAMAAVSTGRVAGTAMIGLSEIEPVWMLASGPVATGTGPAGNSAVRTAATERNDGVTILDRMM
ncbi:hypothetical protein [Rhizobium sp. CAU 1783]